jgi:hypothetical protein
VWLPWTSEPDEVEPWMSKNLADAQLVIFDLGANVLASQMPITTFLGAVVLKARAAGAPVIFMPIASPNAPGTDRLVAAMREDFERLGDVRIIENNADGSGEFLRPVGTQGYATLSFPHIDPGVQAVRMQRSDPLIDVLRSPTVGYELATARLARYLQMFLQQDLLRDIIPSEAVNEITGLATAAPTGLRYKIKDIQHATNSAIQVNAALAAAYHGFSSIDRANRDAVYDAAIRLLEAEESYRSVSKAGVLGRAGENGGATPGRFAA